MPTVTGTFLRADGTPSSGSVAFAPSVAIGDHAEVRLPAPCEVHLDAAGAFEVTLPATDDPDYTPAGWVWQVRERIAGGRDAWYFELTADADYWDLTTVLPPDDYLPWTFTATATTGDPGTDADVDVTGLPPSPVFEFTIPRGDQGDTGDPGPTTDLSIGTVTTLPPGSQATADITGTPPTLTLDLGLPEGDQGDTGPANELTIGTVTTLSPGASATATITGTPPSQTLDLGIPQGAAGSPLSTIDAKGDLLAGSANDTVGRVSVGAIGTNPILIPDTSASVGLKWGTWADADIARASQVGNLLSDADSRMLDGEAWTPSTGATSADPSTEQLFDGEQTLKVIPTGSSTSSQASIPLPSALTTAVPWARLFTFEAMVWADATHTVASWRTNSNNWSNITVVSGWNRIVGSIAIPAGTTNASTFLRMTGTSVSHSPWYVARAAVYEGPPQGRWTPRGQVARTAYEPLAVVQSTASNIALNRAMPVMVNVQGTVTWTLPPAADNYGVQFTLINEGTGVVSVSRASSDTVNGLAFTPTIPGQGNLVIISTGTTWLVLSGKHTTNMVGKATYVWDPTANSTTASAWWRLVKYDSGVRELKDVLLNGWTAANFQISRGTQSVWLEVAGLNGSAATSNVIWNASTALFRPALAIAHPLGVIAAGDTNFLTAATLLRYSSAGLDCNRVSVTDGYGQMSWPCIQQLPTSLPGTQVTAPV